MLHLQTYQKSKGGMSKDRINELTTKNKNKNIRDLYRGIHEFKNGYQPRNNLVKNESDLLADSHKILKRWTIYFPQLLNVHNISDVRQTVTHPAEPILPVPNHLDVEIAIAELKSIITK
jgi:hypothetical protein